MHASACTLIRPGPRQNQCTRLIRLPGEDGDVDVFDFLICLLGEVTFPMTANFLRGREVGAFDFLIRFPDE